MRSAGRTAPANGAAQQEIRAQGAFFCSLRDFRWVHTEATGRDAAHALRGCTVSGNAMELRQEMRRAAWQWRFLGALLLVFGQAALALDPARSLDHYGHQAWRTDSGLPQNTVHSILQTRDGYLWLGTDGGLVRFDGIDFVTFDAENTPQFKSDTVSDLLQDASGTLWISTGAGLLSYRSGAFRAFTTAQGLPADM